MYKLVRRALQLYKSQILQSFTYYIPAPTSPRGMNSNFDASESNGRVRKSGYRESELDNILNRLYSFDITPIQAQFLSPQNQQSQGGAWYHLTFSACKKLSQKEWDYVLYGDQQATIKSTSKQLDDEMVIIHE